MVVTRCLDTYVLMELYYGNRKFLTYSNADVVIPDPTLAEFFGVLLRNHGKTEAMTWFKKLARYAVPVDKETLRDAVEFRQANKKKRISFFDAVGYIYALKKGMAFVTCDKEFKDMNGVEFIRK